MFTSYVATNGISVDVDKSTGYPPQEGSEFQPFGMASIPYGAFAASKCMRKEPEKAELKVSVRNKYHGQGQEPPKFENRKILEYTPVQYNGKMMNSIWGLYNRYSPHNIKKSCDADFSFHGKDQRQGA